MFLIYDSTRLYVPWPENPPALGVPCQLRSGGSVQGFGRALSLQAFPRSQAAPAVDHLLRKNRECDRHLSLLWYLPQNLLHLAQALRSGEPPHSRRALPCSPKAPAARDHTDSGRAGGHPEKGPHSLREAEDRGSLRNRPWREALQLEGAEGH